MGQGQGLDMDMGKGLGLGTDMGLCIGTVIGDGNRPGSRRRWFTSTQARRRPAGRHCQGAASGLPLDAIDLQARRRI